MFPDRIYDLDAPLCFGAFQLETDFAMSGILTAMSGDDEVIRSACNAALFTPLQTAEEIYYRHAILNDARRNAEAVRFLYNLIYELYKQNKIGVRTFSKMSPVSVYQLSQSLLKTYINTLAQIRKTADKYYNGFQSDGLKGLYSMLREELSDKFFTKVNHEIDELTDIDEILYSVSLGDALTGEKQTLRKKTKNVAWHKWILTTLSYNLDYDTSGYLENRRDSALEDISFVLQQAVRYMETFFETLRRELAFYIGCLNLEDTLRGFGMPVCLPEFHPVTNSGRMYRGLYDVSLSLLKQEKVVGNDINDTDIKLYIVTGANQGGKTTFLRSVGQAQLMAQCGMPVGAHRVVIPLRRAVYSHFKREEEKGMRSGKLDEEMQRMDEIIKYMQPNSMVLMNESFVSTNEREGSELCRQITRALVKSNIEVFSVTHLYDYASSFVGADNTMFLRAQRLDSGSRTFRIESGEPLVTAFGEELYRKIFQE